jgi:hypothetical protein
MKKAFWIFPSMIGAFALLISTSFIFAQVQEGEWETTINMKMEGLAFSIPSITTKQCITNDNLVPNASPAKGKDTCKVKDQKVTGNKVTWSGTCVDKDQKSEYEGEITYSGSSYQGTMKFKTIEKSGETMSMAGTMTGRRIGECKDKNKQTVKVGENEIQVDQAEVRKLAEQGQAQMAQIEKDRVEQKARWDAFSKAPVPEEAPGSCSLKGKSFVDSDCKKQIEKFNFKPGEWEITIQKGAMQTFEGKVQAASVEDPQKNIQCITYDAPILSNLDGMWDYKVSPQAISGAMKNDMAKQSGKGGYSFSDENLEGAFLFTIDYGASKTISRTNITGRRIGDGNCQQGRDYTAQKRKTPADAAPNPVKKARKLLGF